MAIEKKTSKATKKNKNTSLQTSLEGRIPPQAVEIERAVIGAVLVEKDSYSDIAQIVSPDSFYVKAHELIFEAVQTLSGQQKPTDIMAVAEELRRTEHLEEIGGIGYLSELTLGVAGAANLDYHAHIVANKALSRKLISYASEVVTSAYEDTEEVDLQMQKAEADLFELSKQNIQKDFVRADTVIGSVLEDIREAGARGDGISGIPTGFPDLDKMTSGWQNSDLIIIAARPAMGKTAFVLSMAKNIAIDHQVPTAVFNLEMDSKQILKRIVSNVCEIENEKLKTGNISDSEWVSLNTKIIEMEDKPLYIDDTPSLSVFELRTKARRLVRDYGVKLIIIDYLQLMNASGMHYGNREQEVSIISRSLKILAKELNIPIIALSQLNRDLEKRQGEANSKRPQLSDLRESGSIEQDADMVCFIHRPEVYRIELNDDNTSTKGMGYLIIAKHRNGQVGDVKLAYHGDFVKFAPMDSILRTNDTLGYSSITDTPW